MLGSGIIGVGREEGVGYRGFGGGVRGFKVR